MSAKMIELMSLYSSLCRLVCNEVANMIKTKKRKGMHELNELKGNLAPGEDKRYTMCYKDKE